MRKVLVALAVAAVVALSGCGSQGAASQSGASVSSAAQAVSEGASAKQADFDGSGFSDTGVGIMVLATAGGTSEGGNVPEIPAVANGGKQLGLNLDGGDGSVCTLYVDGVENTKMNFGERSQATFTVEGDQLHEGVHTVELVKMDGDKPAIYKKAEYKCV